MLRSYTMMSCKGSFAKSINVLDRRVRPFILTMNNWKFAVPIDQFSKLWIRRLPGLKRPRSDSESVPESNPLFPWNWEVTEGNWPRMGCNLTWTRNRLQLNPKIEIKWRRLRVQLLMMDSKCMNGHFSNSSTKEHQTLNP